VASSGGCSPSSGFLNCPRPQLPASHSNSSQQLSKTKLSYDQWSVSQSVLVSRTHLGPKTRFVLLSDSCGCVDVGLLFTIAAGPRQHSHSRVQVPQDSLPYSTVSGLRLPQLEGPSVCIYIPQEQGGPVIPPDTGFPFHRILQLARLR
jgi:hypothetical protein